MNILNFSIYTHIVYHDLKKNNLRSSYFVLLYE